MKTIKVKFKRNDLIRWSKDKDDIARVIRPMLITYQFIPNAITLIYIVELYRGNKFKKATAKDVRIWRARKNSKYYKAMPVRQRMTRLEEMEGMS